jgi:hypothetical protein
VTDTHEATTAFGLEAVDSESAELRRIMNIGGTWTAAAIVGSGLALGPLLASGWRPTVLPVPAAIAFWLGLLAAAAGVALLVWAGCPVLGFTADEAYIQKVFSVRVGIVLYLSGAALAGLAVMLSPATGS